MPKTYRQTILNSNLEEFDLGNFMQFLLDLGLGLVVFGAD
jgi:predicted nuclease of restriction endonuclease-like (RecB) superfamily